MWPSEVGSQEVAWLHINDSLHWCAAWSHSPSHHMLKLIPKHAGECLWNAWWLIIKWYLSENTRHTFSCNSGELIEMSQMPTSATSQQKQDLVSFVPYCAVVFLTSFRGGGARVVVAEVWVSTDFQWSVLFLQNRLLLTVEVVLLN